MWNKVVVCVALCIPTVAAAQGAPSLAPAPPAATEGPPDGLQLQARMSSQLGVSSIISPGFTVGYRSGQFVIAGELGFIAGKLSDNTTTDSFYLVHLMPVVYYDIWQSDDARARLDLVGGIGFGRGKITSETMTSTSDETATYIPILAGLGGDYYLHRNFALGLEFGAELPILTGVKNNGVDSQLSGGIQSLRGMVRVTFVAGR